MRQVELNLSSRPYRNDTPIAVVLALLAVVAIAMTASNTFSYLTSDARRQALLLELSDHQARMQGMSEEADAIRVELEKIDEQTLQSQAAFVAGVLKERNFSWTRLFNELEQAVPWNTRLASIRPSFSGDRVQIDLVGTAQDMQAFFSLQESLEASVTFANVLPSQYESARGRKDVSFSMRFDYAPAPVLPDEDADVAAADEPVRVVVVEDAPVRPAPSAGPPASAAPAGAELGAGTAGAPLDAPGPEADGGSAPNRVAARPAGRAVTPSPIAADGRNLEARKAEAVLDEDGNPISFNPQAVEDAAPGAAGGRGERTEPDEAGPPGGRP